MPHNRVHISSGSAFERRVGYSRAIVEGPWIFVSGTTGYDYATMSLADGVEAQCAQALDNIKSALAEAGASFDDVVRVTYLLPDRDDFEACWPLLSEAFAVARPAATMMVAGLIEPEVRIEIEVTAYVEAGRSQTKSDGGGDDLA